MCVFMYVCSPTISPSLPPARSGAKWDEEEKSGGMREEETGGRQGWGGMGAAQGQSGGIRARGRASSNWAKALHLQEIGVDLQFFALRKDRCEQLCPALTVGCQRLWAENFDSCKPRDESDRNLRWRESF